MSNPDELSLGQARDSRFRLTANTDAWKRLHQSRASVWLLAPVFLFSLACLIACSGPTTRKTPYVTSYGRIEFEFPSDWQRNREKNPFDLQCSSGDQTMNTGIFVYLLDELETQQSPEQIFAAHFDDLRSKRDDISRREQKFTLTDPITKNVATCMTFNGVKNGEAYVYRLSLLEFEQDPNRIAIVLQVGLPDDWENAKKNETLKDILMSARLL